MTEFTLDGLKISSQDLSSLSPSSDDNDRLYNHDGSGDIELTGGITTSRRGFYLWDESSQKWFPSFENANLLDGKEAGDFLISDGSGAMSGDLDFDSNGIINLGTASGVSGSIRLNTNHVELAASSTGSNIRLLDANGALIAEAIEGGDFDVPNGQLSEQGSRVATRQWTNANADVSNADYADDANSLDGYDESAFLHVAGDQLEGVLDLASNNIKDGTSVLWDAVNSEVPQVSLGGPASSLSSYPLAAGDLAESYVKTSRLPLIASDLAFDPATQSELDTHAGTTDAHHTRYANSEAIAAVNAEASLSVDISGDADTLDGEHASAFADSTHTHAHSDLTGVGASDHHTRYADSEAIAALGGYTFEKNGTDGTGVINFKT